MRIYTRKGDLGESLMPGGTKLSKSDALMETVGALDELNCAIGVASVNNFPPEIDGPILRIQTRIFEMGALITMPSSIAPADWVAEIEQLEGEIDFYGEGLPELRNFVLPGGGAGAASLHMARAICRRAERSLVNLSHNREIDANLLAFINRLSDWLFAAARWVNHHEGGEERIWRPDR